MRRLLLLFGFLLAVLLAASPAWALTTQWYPSGPYGGDVRVFLRTPTALYATTSYGVFRSTDGGTTWTDCTPAWADPGFTNQGVSDIAYDQVSGAVYVAGKDYRVYWTTDGATWKYTSALGPAQSYYPTISSIAGEVYAATVYGLKYTTDGVNWVDINTTAYYDAPVWTDLSNNIFIFKGSTVLKKPFDSNTWASLTAPGALAMNNKASISCDATGTIYGAFQLTLGGVTYYRVYKSVDGGVTWTDMTTTAGWPGATSIGIDGSTFIAGTPAGFQTSADGGTTWSGVSTNGLYPGFSVAAVTHTPDGYFIGTPLGVFKSTDGITATFFSQGMRWGVRTDQVLALSGMNMVALDATTLFARSPYGIYKSTDGGQSWKPFIGVGGLPRGQGMLVSNDGYLCYAVAGGGFYKVSPADGTPVASVTAGVNSIAKDVYGNLYYSDLYNVYKSTDNGLTWATYGPALPVTPQSLYVAPDGTAYVGSNANWYIYRWSPGATSWNLVFTNCYATTITQDIYGTFFACGCGSGKSTDGINWSAIQIPLGGVLQNVSARAVAIDAQNSIYLSVDLPSGRNEVFKSVDGGQTWFSFSTGIPIDAVTTYLFAAPNNTVFAMTNKGIYDPPVGIDNVCPVGSLSFFTELPVLTDGSIVVTNATVSFTVYGSDNNAVTDFMIGTDPAFTGSSWQPFSGSPMTASITLSSPGKKTIYVRLRDANGNTTDLTQSVCYDAAPPNVNDFYADSSVVLSPSITFHVSVTEDVEPSEFMLSEDPNFTGASWVACSWTQWVPGGPFSTDLPFTLSGEGTKTIYLKVKDCAGRESAAALCTVNYLKPALAPTALSTPSDEDFPAFDERGTMYYVKDGDVYRFDPAAKTEQKISTGANFGYGLQVRNGFAVCRNNPNVLNLATGELIPMGVSPGSVATDGVYAATTVNGDVYLFDIAARQGRFLTSDGYAVPHEAAAVGGGKVFCVEYVNYKRQLHAIDVTTGTDTLIVAPVSWWPNIYTPQVIGQNLYWVDNDGETCRLARVSLAGGSATTVLSFPGEYCYGAWVSEDGKWALVNLDDVLFLFGLSDGKKYLVEASDWYGPAISPQWVAWTRWDSVTLGDVYYAPLSQLNAAPSAPAASPVSSGGGGGRYNPDLTVDLGKGGSGTVSARGVSVSVEAPSNGEGKIVCRPDGGTIEVVVTGKPNGARITFSGGAFIFDDSLDAWVPVDRAIYGVIDAVYREGGKATLILSGECKLGCFTDVPDVTVVISNGRLRGFAHGLSSVRVMVDGAEHAARLHEGGFECDVSLGPGRHVMKCLVERNGRKFLCFEKRFWRYADFERHWAYKAAGVFLEEHPEVFGEQLYLLPDLPAKRGEVAKLLKAALDLPDPGGEVPFKDVPASDGTLASAARAVYDAGLMVGYPDGTLGAERDISRVETAVLMARLAKRFGAVPAKPVPAFKDFGRVPAWAREAVREAAAMEIVSGYPDKTFRPSKKVTRAESAVLTLRTARLKSPGLEERAKGI
ncbi:S-layer family protein [Thermodesulfitimonas autotrophica]|uniref:S-layer family protein n=1 Tax=Thermodesulfitimonas autotrophica TaxID=1894989 RepID=A0A3N5AWY4_9THEO|nr:S-layer homology domain-containing protein [Thermodesulfitimonas autotrophica]RPF49529.1 S-layer family protein [Thermodesulfitimonas autotrophica]